MANCDEAKARVLDTDAMKSAYEKAMDAGYRGIDLIAAMLYAEKVLAAAKHLQEAGNES